MVAPEAYSEHPNWPANYGAYYVSEILNALTANPEVWSKTVFIIMYDENDGFFDHVVPPTPPQNAAEGQSNVSIENEIFPGSAEYPSGPYGLGARVPMLVVSPWSKGGWVNSEVFDHTSLIRFVQQRFGTKAAPLTDPNITPWRAAVSGDLTSAFNFATPNSAVVKLPSTAGYVPPDDQRHNSYIPLPPVVQSLPIQETGVRPARAVPYALHVAFSTSITASAVTLTFTNKGKKAAFFQVRSANPVQTPRGYTVAPGTSLTDTWAYGVLAVGAYDLSVYGPNGFFRTYRGAAVVGVSTNLQSAIAYEIADNAVTLNAVNNGSETCQIEILNAYNSTTQSKQLKAGARWSDSFSVTNSHGWYDFILTNPADPAFRQQLAGHLESGKDSMTDPAIAKTSGV